MRRTLNLTLIGIASIATLSSFPSCTHHKSIGDSCQQRLPAPAWGRHRSLHDIRTVEFAVRESRPTVWRVVNIDNDSLEHLFELIASCSFSDDSRIFALFEEDVRLRIAFKDGTALRLSARLASGSLVLYEDSADHRSPLKQLVSAALADYVLELGVRFGGR